MIFNGLGGWGKVGSPGAYALANGLNANQVHRWMRERGIEPPSRRKADSAALTALAEPGFVPVQVAPAVEARVIRLEAQRGNARVKLEWPLEAAEACGVWLREWLA
jgi:hypothetical protein